MKIHVRIPTVQYGFLEPVYESVEEYKEKHLEFVKAVSSVHDKVEEWKKLNEKPF